jgi:nucleotide-binding universal stress UspA family protein
MFQKILLPIDMSDRHDAAMKMAAQLARAGNGKVILLHVVELIAGLDRQQEGEFYQRLERQAREHLTRLGSNLARQGVSWRAEVGFGSRAIDAAAFASEQKVDVIVLTSPLFRPEHPISGLGSMAWKISFIAPCPVLLVKNEKPAAAADNR